MNGNGARRHPAVLAEPQLTDAEAEELAPAAVASAAANERYQEATDETNFRQVALNRAIGEAKSVNDARVLRCQAALDRAREDQRLAHTDAERALVRVTTIKLGAQNRRRDELLAASLKESAEWQQREQAKRDAAVRNNREYLEREVARRLDG